MSKRIVLLAGFLFLIPLCLLAQPRKNYQLLWRIEGNGLTVPSYLFGTMHVKDSRAFQFADSVYLAIEKCDGFALEVHPDSMYTHMFSTMLEEKNKNYFREYSEEDDEYAEFARRFTEETGLGIDQLNYTDPWSFDMLYSGAKKRYDDFPVFVDAWLYRMARDQGKLIFGVESMEDHTDLFESLDEAQQREVILSRINTEESELEQMIKLYYSGNIDSLMEFMERGMTEDYQYHLLTKRNYVMANSMDSLSHVRPTFFAVGSGHLPGEEGVIELLRKKGYTMTPVEARFTGVSKTYVPERVAQKWHKFQLEDLGLNLEFPGKPIDMNLSTEMAIYLYPDLATGRNYMLMTVASDRYQSSTADVALVIERAIDGMSRQGEVMGKKMLEIDGRPVGEIIMKQKMMGGMYRVHLMIENDLVYFLMVGVTKEDIRSADADKFLASAELYAPRVPESAWKEFRDEAGAFVVEMPGKPLYEPRLSEIEDSEAAYHLHNYELYQNATKSHFFVQYYDQPPGYFITDSTIIWERAFDWIHDEAYGVELDTTHLLINDIPGVKVSAVTSEGEAYQALAFQRGNRVYLVTAQTSDSENSASLDRFVNSFQPVPFQSNKLIDIPLYDSTIVVRFSEDYFKLHEELELESSPSIDSGYYYSWMDPVTGVNMTMNVWTYGKYKYIPHVDSMILEDLKRVETETIELDSIHPWQPNGGAEMMAFQSKVNYPRGFTSGWEAAGLVGSNFFNVVIHYPPELEGIYIDSLINNLRFFNVPPLADYSDPSLERVFAGIFSADSAERAAAVDAIIEYPVEAKDLARFIEATGKVLEQEGEPEVYHYSYFRQMEEKLAEVADGSVLEELEALFKHEAMYTRAQIGVLHVLADIKTKESLTLMLNLYQQLDKPGESLWLYQIMKPFKEDADLTREFLRDLMSLLPDKDLNNYIFASFIHLMEESPEDVSKVMVYKEVFLSILKKEKDQLTVNEEAYYTWSELDQMLQITTFMEDDKNVISLLKEISLMENYEYLQVRASVYLLKRGQKIPKKTIREFAAWESNYIWYELLMEQGLTEILQPGELTQEKVAEMMLRKYIANKEELPREIVLLKKKQVAVSGTDQLVYIYKIRYEGSWYVAISGLQPVDPDAYEFNDAFCNTHFDTYRLSTFARDSDTLIEEMLEYQNKEAGRQNEKQE